MTHQPEGKRQLPLQPHQSADEDQVFHSLGLRKREQRRNKATGRRADQIHVVEFEPIKHVAQPLGRCLPKVHCPMVNPIGQTPSGTVGDHDRPRQTTGSEGTSRCPESGHRG